MPRHVAIIALVALAVGVTMGIFWKRMGTIAVPTVEEQPNGLTRLSAAFLRERFAAYSPTKHNPLNRDAGPVSEESIREDLHVVRPYFSAIVTYSCHPGYGLDRIVQVARELDMRVVLGIWDIGSVAEIETAVRLTKRFPDTVIAVLVGNETLLRGGKWEALDAAIRLVKAALPDVPVSTSEPISSYGNEDLRRAVTFHAPNVHWIFHSGAGRRQDIDGAVDWLLERAQALRELDPKPILIKEHGMPSSPEPFTEVLQSSYWAKLLAHAPNSKTQAVVFFESFNLPFKKLSNPSELSETEGHWGAWTDERKSKPVVDLFPRIPVGRQLIAHERIIKDKK